jgi:hypothetical protein
MNCSHLPFAAASGPDDPTESMIGRRETMRLPVEFVARLQIDERLLDVLVVDVSETGARLRIRASLRAGPEGRLIWEGISCACRIIWAAPETCGIQLEELDLALDPLARAGDGASQEPADATSPIRSDRGGDPTSAFHTASGDGFGGAARGALDALGGCFSLGILDL